MAVSRASRLPLRPQRHSASSSSSSLSLSRLVRSLPTLTALSSGLCPSALQPLSLSSALEMSQGNSDPRPTTGAPSPLTRHAPPARHPTDGTSTSNTRRNSYQSLTGYNVRAKAAELISAAASSTSILPPRRQLEQSQGSWSIPRLSDGPLASERRAPASTADGTMRNPSTLSPPRVRKRDMLKSTLEEAAAALKDASRTIAEPAPRSTAGASAGGLQYAPYVPRAARERGQVRAAQAASEGQAMPDQSMPDSQARSSAAFRRSLTGLSSLTAPTFSLAGSEEPSPSSSGASTPSLSRTARAVSSLRPPMAKLQARAMSSRSGFRLPEHASTASSGQRTMSFGTASPNPRAAPRVPPPGHVRPILMPTYAMWREENGIEVEASASAATKGQTRAGAKADGAIVLKIRGHVERWPDTIGRTMKMWMGMGKQLAGLPKLRQRTESSGILPGSSTHILPGALVAEPDDACFFPEVPNGVLSNSPTGSPSLEPLDALGTPKPENDAAESETEGARPRRKHKHDALPEKLAETFIEEASEKVIATAMRAFGALPGDPHEEEQARHREGRHGHHREKDEEGEAGRRRAEAKGDNTMGESGATSSYGPIPVVGGSSAWWGRPLADLHGLQANLDYRLRAFWTYRVASRTVRIEVLPIFADETADEEHWSWGLEHWEMGTDAVAKPPRRVMAVTELKTDASGQVSTDLKIPTSMLRRYLDTDGDDKTRARSVDDVVALRVRAVLPSDRSPFATLSEEEEEAARRGEKRQDEVAYSAWHTIPVVRPRAPDNAEPSTDEEETITTPRAGSSDVTPPTMTLTATPSAPSVAHELPPHVISDIDDTIKHSHIVAGVRAVFKNVFVRFHDEVQIPGVREWYGDMRERFGAQFHYVSNAPLELHGVVRDYLSTAGMPIGHLALKSYPSSSSRSLLTSYLQPASARKRATVLSILSDFPTHPFLLVGDSGEMDLELYAEIAQLRPHQIKGIWIRDVSTPAPLAKSPTSSMASSSASSLLRTEDVPGLNLGSARSSPTASSIDLQSLGEALEGDGQEGGGDTTAMESKAKKETEQFAAQTLAPPPRAALASASASASAGPSVENGGNVETVGGRTTLQQQTGHQTQQLGTGMPQGSVPKPRRLGSLVSLSSTLSSLSSNSTSTHATGGGGGGGGGGTSNPSASAAPPTLSPFEGRLAKAKAIVPPHIPLRTWRVGQDAQEEAAEILKALQTLRVA